MATDVKTATERAVEAYHKMLAALDECIAAEEELKVALRLPGVDLEEYSRAVTEAYQNGNRS